MDALGSAERERLVAQFGKRFTSGQVIFREGEAASEAHLLQDGRVRLQKRVRAVERPLVVVGAGDLFGESALLAESAHGATAVALSDVATIALGRAALESVLETQPAFAARLMAKLVRRLRDTQDQLMTLMLGDGQSKIVHALLTLAAQTPGDGATPRLLRITPLELAARVGQDVESVKRGIQKLRSSDYVRVADEAIEIPAVEPLERLFALLGVKDEIEGRSFSSPVRRT